VIWVERTSRAYFDKEGKLERVVGMVTDITERKQYQDTLAAADQKLIYAHEEERVRLARELHDDINQQISLLAVRLDRLRQTLPASSSPISQEISEALRDIDSLAVDIQALSHRMHSSKLEHLGIESAARAFCKETADRQGVEIQFDCEAVPEGLTKEVSLCLFRVLQEALQNSIKHSGSKHFRVSLKAGTNEIELAVHDTGTGFKPEEAFKGRGIGLRSMKERLKVVNGKISIDSEMGRGSTIYARVPLNPKPASA